MLDVSIRTTRCCSAESSLALLLTLSLPFAWRRQQATDWGLGEPLNIIISSRSSPDVLRESGFIAYSRSLGFWAEVRWRLSASARLMRFT